MWAKPLIDSATVPKPGRGAYGPVWPKPGAAHDDEPRIDGVQDVRAEAPALERARPEALDEHVGVATSSLSSSRALGLAEVDRDEALVAVDERPPQRDAVLLPAERPQRVAARVLDLDDVGAEVGEQRRR